VVIQRFQREPLNGFVNMGTLLRPDGLEVLTPSGTVSLLPWTEVKIVRFVRDFDSHDADAGRTAFLSRPRVDGVWVKVAFTDGDTLEGVMPNNLLHMEAEGVYLTPPDSAVRIFVPRSALTSVQVLGVVGGPLTKNRRKPAAPKAQIGLFEA